MSLLSSSIARLAFVTIALAPTTAFAGGLTVASDPGAPSVARPVAEPDAFSEEVENEREGVSIAGSAYLFSGAAIDDFRQGGVIIRPQLEVYAAFGLGEVSMLLGGTVLGVEATHFDNRDGMSVPVLGVIGIRDDTWQVAAAGGISVATDDSYGEDIIDNEESLPSPRGEARFGYRFAEVGELMGIVGAERRMYANREDATRFFFGLSIGFGADDNAKPKK